MELITLNTQRRLVKYFQRLDTLKPSDFDKNFPKEFAYLRILSELVLRPEQKRKNNYQVIAHQVRFK